MPPANTPASNPGGKTFFGHPRGLSTLFFTEMWERFSFYGMRALLRVFVATAAVQGGLGFAESEAHSIYHIYLSLVYLVSVPGGWIADRFLGQRRSVMYGAAVIMLGHICLAVHSVPSFFAGLALVVIGTGLLKPNASTIVGQIYSPTDARRDAGFSIFYMGINLGAFLGPLVCGWLAQDEGFRTRLSSWGIPPERAWQFAFGAAAVGMFFGLVQYMLGSSKLGDAGLAPSKTADPAGRAKDRRTLLVGLVLSIVAIGAIVAATATGALVLTVDLIDESFGIGLTVLSVAVFAWLFLKSDWTGDERRRLFVITVLFLASCFFWSAFEQAGSTLNAFAKDNTSNSLFGFEFPSTWFQSVNALFIITLAPVIAWFWIRLGKRDPSHPGKFAWGLFFAGLGFLVLAPAAILAKDGARVSPMWLTAVYLCHTIGELCLSPVGLSAFSKLAPARVAGMMMGVWFLSISVGSYMGGRIAKAYVDFDKHELCLVIAGFTIVPAIVLALCAKPIRRMIEARSEGTR
ncbi:MAG: peptide MFS transporter [Planctomycetota bacterium]